MEQYVLEPTPRSLNEYEMKNGHTFVYRYVTKQPESMFGRVKKSIGLGKSKEVTGYRTGNRKGNKYKANAFYGDDTLFTASTMEGAKFFAEEVANSQHKDSQGYIITINVKGIPQIDTHAQYKKIKVPDAPITKTIKPSDIGKVYDSYYKKLDKAYEKYEPLLKPTKMAYDKNQRGKGYQDMNEKQKKRNVVLNAVTYSRYLSDNDEVAVNTSGDKKPKIVKVTRHTGKINEYMKKKQQAWQEQNSNSNQIA